MATESSAIIRLIDLVEQQPIIDPFGGVREDTQLVRPRRARWRRGLIAGAALALIGGAVVFLAVEGRFTSASGASAAAVSRSVQPERQPPIVPAVLALAPTDNSDSNIASAPKLVTKTTERAQPQVKPPSKRLVRPRVRKQIAQRRRTRPTAVKKTRAKVQPGILMVGAKPPCAIFIDGKHTGLTTPQRSIRLSPGLHSVVLINAEYKIRARVGVTITSGKKSRVVRDFSSRITRY